MLFYKQKEYLTRNYKNATDTYLDRDSDAKVWGSVRYYGSHACTYIVWHPPSSYCSGHLCPLALLLKRNTKSCQYAFAESMQITCIRPNFRMINLLLVQIQPLILTSGTSLAFTNRPFTRFLVSALAFLDS